MSQQNPDHYIPTPLSDQEKASWGQSSVLWGGTPQVVVKSKSAIVAYVLWFFLGWFGIHKFYLNAPIMGLLYLVLNGLGWALAIIFVGYFFWFILGLLWIIDIFTIPLRVGFLNSIATARANSYRM